VASIKLKNKTDPTVEAAEAGIAIFKLAIDAQTNGPARRSSSFKDLPHDVLVLIGEIGLKDDPTFNLRLAAICCNWRNEVLKASTLWNDLVLTNRKPVVKAKLWMSRSNGLIRRLELRGPFSAYERREIIKAITPAIPFVRELFLTCDYGIKWQWGEKFNELEVVDGNSVTFSLDSLAPTARSLRHISLASIRVAFSGCPFMDSPHFPPPRRQPPSVPQPNVPPMSHPETQLASVQTLNLFGLVGCPLQCLLAYLPRLHTLSIGDYHDGSVFCPQHRALNSCYLPSVTRLGVGRNYHPFNFNAPLLTQLYFHTELEVERPIFRHARADAILGGLTQLDLSECDWNVDDLVFALPKLPLLEYLNLSYPKWHNACATPFLQALIDNNGHLPRLTALGLAGYRTDGNSPTLQPKVLVDFVKKRTNPTRIAHGLRTLQCLWVERVSGLSNQVKYILESFLPFVNTAEPRSPQDQLQDWKKVSERLAIMDTASLGMDVHSSDTNGKLSPTDRWIRAVDALAQTPATMISTPTSASLPPAYPVLAFTAVQAVPGGSSQPATSNRHGARLVPYEDYEMDENDGSDEYDEEMEDDDDKDASSSTHRTARAQSTPAPETTNGVQRKRFAQRKALVTSVKRR